jgi:hypothetical protein
MEETNKNAKTIQQLAVERKAPKMRLQRHKRRFLGKIGYVFIFFGISALASSIIYNSSILAFIGLGLTLWGGLFLFIKPTKYVKSSVFDSTTLSLLTNIDKILTELNYQGQAVHLPPRHLKELKEGVVFIPMNEGTVIPREEVTKGKIFMNPEGICLTSPGQGLLNLYEKELRTDLSKRDLNYLKTNLPRILIEDLEILEDLEISEQNDKVFVKITGSVYQGLCNHLRNNTRICSRLGCPLCSSIACALAKATGKAVAIEKNKLSTDGKIVEIWYRLIKVD